MAKIIKGTKLNGGNINHEYYIDQFKKAIEVNSGTLKDDTVIGYLVLWKAVPIKSPEAGGVGIPKFMEKRNSTPDPEKSLDWAVRQYNIKHRKDKVQCAIIKHNGTIFIRHFSITSNKTDKTKVDVENKEMAELDKKNDTIISNMDKDWVAELKDLYRFRRDYYISNEVSTYLRNYMEAVGGIKIKEQTNIYFVHKGLMDIIDNISKDLEQHGGKLYLIPYRTDPQSIETLEYSMMEDFNRDMKEMKEKIAELKGKRQTDGYPGGLITEMVKLYKKLAVWKDIFGQINEGIIKQLNEFEDILRQEFTVPGRQSHSNYLNKRIQDKIDKINKTTKVYQS